MNFCFICCGFDVAGTHLGASSTVATPSARSFYTPWAKAQILTEARGCSSCQGSVLAWAVGWLPDSTAARPPCLGLSLSHQYFVISLPFVPRYLQFAVSQLHLSLLCPQNWAPLTNTPQEKLQQNEKDEVGPWLPSSQGSRSQSLRGWFFLTKEVQNKVDKGNSLKDGKQKEKSKAISWKGCQERHSSQWRTL